MSRAIAYIDGFNLYHGLRSKGWREYYWLDLSTLAAALLKPGQTLEATHYFTSRTKPFTQEPDWALTSINMDLSELLKRAEAPCQT